MADRLGHQLGTYRLTQLLGTGGFAEVYLGEHIHLGTKAAVKLLHTQLATVAEGEKFRQEARIIATLGHPNIVRVLDFDVEEGTPYLVMDYAPNGSLRQLLPAGVPLAPARIAPYLAQVAEALQYAHEQKLVHRDIKPENMLLGRQNEVLLSDFGIATVAQSTSQQKTEGVAGTTAYMSPEQLQGKPRPASDLYSLGVVIYEWLAGERPFQGSFVEVATQHLFTLPPPLREKVPSISPEVEQVVLTALAKDPRERFGSVRAFATAFGQACGEAGSAYMVASQPIVPPAPANALPAALSQASTILSPTPAQAGTPPGGQAAQAGGSIFSATTQLTPQLTPPRVSPSSPSELLGQAGTSLFSAETHLIPPASAPSADSGGANTRSTPGLTVPSTPPASGWAAQQSGAGPDTSLPATAETAYRAKGAAAASDERTLANGPLAPGALASMASTKRGKGGFRRWVVAVAACLLVLALIGSGIAFGLPLLLRSASPGSAGATGAIVTITPESLDLNQTLTLTGVTGTPDPSKQQVGARAISVTTQSYSQTVNATGRGTTPGTQAHTIFDVYNNLTTYLNIAAGASYPNMGCAGSITIVLDARVSVAPSGATYSVPGHIAEVGPVNVSGCSQPIQYAAGNCGGYACVFINAHIADTFTNGTNPQTYPVVQQSDIDGAANSLMSANQPNAELLVQGQLRPGEQLAGTPQCTPNKSADHNAGDAAKQVMVTVTFTCTGEAYDHDGALTLAKHLLTDQAASTPGAGYALVGTIKTTLVSAISDNQERIAIVVTAEGIWAYQISQSQRQTLARLIAGKSKQDAILVLSAQPGIAQANIQSAGGSGQALPTDPSQITINVQAISGV